MLERLSIRNFILIDELDIELEKGLCVITGETGSGKSIILDAILFCLGYKFPSSIIKHGKDYCLVSAIFSLDDAAKILLEQINVEYEHELLIKAVQKAGNRKSFFVNDQLVSQTTLQKLADYLIDLHGQNNHTLLLQTSSHLEILDDYGNLAELRTALNKCFSEWHNITKEINKIKADKDDLDKEIDYLDFVTNELTQLNIQTNEEEELSDIRSRLQNRDKETQLIRDILLQLNNSEINQAISKAQRLITRNSLPNKELVTISNHIEEAYNNLEEARTKLQHIIDNLDQEEHRLEEIEDRLFAIKGIARKYNIPATEINNFLSNSRQQLHLLKEKIINAEALGTRQILVHNKYLELANILTKKRLEVATTLKSTVQHELKQLKMEKAIFDVEITAKETPTNVGLDSVIFTASTNPGMTLAPINKIASGGELSRFMLALKTSLFDKFLKPTIIFDEIDTGIGGIAADKVGDRLKKLGTIAQVIVITHQPQVAGKADQHIKVDKSHLDAHTEVSVKTLQTNERQHELARMISGKEITKASLNAAKELMN